MNCIIKKTHEDRVRLMHAITWCGGTVSDLEFHFTDPNHAAAACEYGSLDQPCQACKEALVAALTKGDS